VKRKLGSAEKSLSVNGAYCSERWTGLNHQFITILQHNRLTSILPNEQLLVLISASLFLYKRLFSLQGME